MNIKSVKKWSTKSIDGDLWQKALEVHISKVGLNSVLEDFIDHVNSRLDEDNYLELRFKQIDIMLRNRAEKILNDNLN